MKETVSEFAYRFRLAIIMPVVENVAKTTEIIEIDWHVSSRSIAQDLKIDHKAVLNHLRKVGFKKKLYVWVQYHQKT
ncbi:hypothetical protein TNCV_4983101 [Trichonephila clavipes]|uniref:Uncharacterized protein n=1 Tax=Trichonephila clavipes TaxID=2585209 RepID=A0A8X6WGG7_TRICX|nr:hypothetical protein TNCV_4983101 [Trichonephila clavipes]